MNGFETIMPFLKPIEHLLLDDSISEVMVNGADCVFIEKQGFLEPVRGVALGERALLVAAVIPPCSLRGVTLTIRKFNKRHFEIDDLIATGTLDRALANRLEDYVLTRKNVLVAGGTGAGKTSLLNSLAQLIPEDERLLLIEDTAEIQISH